LASLNRKLPCCILALCSVAAALPEECLAGDSAVRRPARGAFRMRAELRGKHPRLYFTRKDIPRLRQLALGPNRWFLERAKKSFGGRFGKDVKPNMASWERYVYGFWGLFAADMLHVAEGKPVYADTAKRWAMWLAKDRWWVKDDLIPMDCLTGLALTYDILHDRFTEPERRQIREALWEGIRFISKRFFVGQYWTRDYQNNHMHNRMHALAHASFALYGDDPAMDCRPYADLAYDSVRNLVKWLPEDGSTHEGPGYWSYGHHWVERVVHLAEHVTGEDLTSANPHFANSHWYGIYMAAPGWKECFGIGDGGGFSNLTAIARSVAAAKDGLGQGFLQLLMKRRADGFYQHPAWGALWYDATIKPLPVESAPLWRLWPDLDMFSIRSSWKDDATAFVFKCGPPGGHKMQKMRAGDWVNVAHDHPDQNHFMLFAHGKMLADDDGYPKKKKLTRSHNTIVIDGKGTPREGTGWYQPFAYDKTAFIEDVFLSHRSAYAAGNASRCYEGADRFVRHVAFVDGEYAILLDDLVGAGGGEHEFEWRLHKDGKWSKRGPGRFSVADGEVSLAISFLAPEPARLASKFLPAELTAKPCLAVNHRARRAQFACVLVPYKGNMPRIEAELLSSGREIAIRARGPEHEDLFGVSVASSTRPASFVMGDAKVTARGALVRRARKGEAAMALLVNGTSLTLNGKTLLGASRPANVSFRREGNKITVEAEASYRKKAGATTLRIGGLARMSRYTVTVDGGRAGPKAADGSGVVRVDVDLSARRVIELRK